MFVSTYTSDPRGLKMMYKDGDVVFISFCNTDEAIEILANKLRTDSEINTLKFSSSYGEVTPVGAYHLANMLRHNTTITSLDLHRSQIQTQGAIDIMDALKVNTTLTHLTLTDNMIDHRGTQYIAEVLQYNFTLTALYINFNLRTDSVNAQIDQALTLNKRNRRNREVTLFNLLWEKVMDLAINQ